MRKYNHVRKIEDIESLMSRKMTGLITDTELLKKGSDWIIFKGELHALPLSIIFNVVNGQFMVFHAFTGNQIADHTTEELDVRDWYSDLLDIFYEKNKVS